MHVFIFVNTQQKCFTSYIATFDHVAFVLFSQNLSPFFSQPKISFASSKKDTHSTLSLQLLPFPLILLYSLTAATERKKEERKKKSRIIIRRAARAKKIARIFIYLFVIRWEKNENRALVGGGQNSSIKTLLLHLASLFFSFFVFSSFVITTLSLTRTDFCFRGLALEPLVWTRAH